MARTVKGDYPQPLIKWAGGKRGIIPQLQDLMPDDVHPDFSGRFIEPFVGGAAMFFYLKPKEAILADMNEELINLYTQVSERPKDFMTVLDEMGSCEYCKETYYEVRASQPTDDVERAARTVFLNRWGWNGLYRVNKKGGFNVPFGATSNGQKPMLYNADNVMAVSELMKRADLRVASYEDTLKEAADGDFVFMDPPYHPLSVTSSFTSYTKLDFTLEDQAKLCDSILEVEERTDGKARMMLSNSVAPDLIELYERKNNLRLHTVVAFRAISAKKSSRGGQAELVVTNY